ncbi:hypothetical protein D3C84_1004310 [compost metagenome]
MLHLVIQLHSERPLRHEQAIIVASDDRICFLACERLLHLGDILILFDFFLKMNGFIVHVINANSVLVPFTHPAELLRQRFIFHIVKI